jgi:HNH endonuclease
MAAGNCVRISPNGITDRALRYRAQKCVSRGPKHCAICGSTRFLTVDHRDGHEENNRPSNLRWLCKSCNNREGAAMVKAGRGRRTRQYNPGAKSLAEYVHAILGHRRGARDEGGKIIHETPKAKRREFAGEIWDRRKARGNPVDAARDLAEAFHGRSAGEVIEVIEELEEHGVLADLGRLNEIVIRKPKRTIRFDKNTRLASSEGGTQLFIVGGDQSVDLGAFPDVNQAKETVVLGEAESITYTTAKFHLGEEDKESGPYQHEFAEEGGTRPLVIYDTRNQLLSLAGGSYVIEIDMDGKYSAGIKD